MKHHTTTNGAHSVYGPTQFKHCGLTYWKIELFTGDTLRLDLRWPIDGGTPWIAWAEPGWLYGEHATHVLLAKLNDDNPQIVAAKLRQIYITEPMR